MNYDELLHQIFNKVDMLSAGETFTLKQLFEEDEWESIPAKCRRMLGRIYKSKLNRGQIKNVEWDDDTTWHTHIYKKVK